MRGLHFVDPFPAQSRAVLLLHGLGANCSSWMLQFDALNQSGFRPIAPDMPGFGESKYDGRGWNFISLSRKLAELVQELDCGQVDVVGLSMGGVIAQQLVLDFPAYVHKLVLVSTFSELRPTNLSQLFYFAQRMLAVHVIGLEAQSRIVAERLFPNSEQFELRKIAEEQIKHADPRAYRAAMRNLSVFSSKRRLIEINKPTLVISGSNDTTVGPMRQKLSADGIAGASFVSIPKAGDAVAVDHSEEFNKILLEFLA